ncbi:hypothetical protein [Nesterenkonia flava]|uniref:Dehydrogenase n=1 Tax=Nesterenkonia flava TaxID=469799 RepID=A0ABU1FQS0_9MICC|nr:hypothetical protein [Nesterenkonia flava]MDR5710991.1 hypothetical protein [Nesterenkonia flava]
MKLFTRRRRARRMEKELGTGLWRQAHDRYVRGLDRYHQILEGVEDDQLHNQLVLIGDELAEQLPTVYDLCRTAHEVYPAEGMQVPGGAANRLHSCLSRAANHLATTAEAAAMARLQHGTVEAVRRRADQVMSCLQDAEAALAGE